MSHDQEFDRTRPHPAATVEVDHDVEPNRITTSSKLDAPARPIASGLLLRKARDANGVAAGADAAVAAASSSSGSALPATLMRKFEGALGADLSSVRLHTGAESQDAASAVGAKAYTMGQDIHFGAGHYDPSSSAGQHLIAHEVAHTVQQRGGSPVRQNKLEVSSPFDAAEHEADRAADAMIAGAPATIAGAPVSAARLIQRDPLEGGEAAGGEHKQQINEKTTFEVPEVKFNKPFGKYVQLVGSLRGKMTVEVQKKAGEGGGESAQVAVGPSGSAKGAGIGAEITLAETAVKRAIFGVKFDDKTEDKINFVLNGDKLEVSVSHEARLSFPQLPWLKGGGDLKFVFAGVDWAELQKHPDAIEVAAADVALVLGGEGNMTFESTVAKAGVEVSVGVKASPNWKKILAEAGKKFAKEVAKEGAKEAGKQVVKEGAKEVAKQGVKEVGKQAAKGAAEAGAEAAGATAAETAIAVDAGAVAGSAAAIIAPLAVGALMIYGGMQAGANRDVGQAATAYAAKARDAAHAYAKSYAQTIAGHELGGSGAAAAEAVLAQAMAGGLTREQASAGVLRNSGGYAAVENGIYAQIRDKLYATGVAAMEDRFRPNFGLLEKVGETWGMRGVIRKDLHQVMYAD